MSTPKPHESLAAGSPINKAHEHAALAEELYLAGDWEGAIEEHFKASEMFLACLQYTKEQSVQSTLRRMYTENSKAAREIQLRIDQAKANQKPGESSKTPATLNTYGSSVTEGATKSTSPTSPSRTRPTRTPGRKPSNNAASSSYTPRPTRPNYNQISPPQPVGPDPYRRLQDSTGSEKMIDESYMFLGSRQPEPSDSFNMFMEILEGMLENLSQPVAFATAPLVPISPTFNPASEGEGNNGRDQGQEEVADLTDPEDSSGADSFYIVPSSSASTSLSPSSSSIATPQGRSLSSTVTPTAGRLLSSSADKEKEKALRDENARLKAELERTKEQLTKTQDLMKARVGQEMASLRDSIMVARREAQRRMLVSSATLNVGGQPKPPSTPPLQSPGLIPSPHIQPSMGSNLPIPPRPTLPIPPMAVPAQIANIPLSAMPTMPSIPILDLPPSTAVLQKRVKELEEELRNARIENEKLNAQCVRFRQKWDKLKESAKSRKRSKEGAPAPGSSPGTSAVGLGTGTGRRGTSGVHEGIPEEDEAAEE